MWSCSWIHTAEHGTSETVREIVVSDYNADWPLWFEKVRDYVWPAVMDVALGIDHVGSTAVPGLAAKPIVDMDIVVAAEGDLGPVIERLSGVGYTWRGDLGVPGREAFSSPSHIELPPHHLYLVVKDNRAHLDHYLLRDLLRADPKAREAYGALKRHNVELAQGDIDVYLALKAGLVAGLLGRAREGNGPVNTVRRATPSAVGNTAGQLPRPGLDWRGGGVGS